MEQLCSFTESVRVKSGSWDTNNCIFIYTTLNHIKYCLINGDTGIIRTLDVPVYITRVASNQLFCLDRECKTRVISIDTTEAAFKLALEDKNYPEVMHMVRNSRLCGKAIIGYLQDKGFPEVALHFVDDLKTRFKLALACGNIEIAMNTAYEMGDDLSWHRLGIEALRQGNHQVVEMAYQRTKNFERLSFLYLLTGNTEKLRKMLKIAEMRQDIMARFHNALFLGDVLERVKVLEDAGQVSLAYLTSLTHGLVDAEERLKLGLPEGVMPAIHGDAHLMQPPTPIIHADNWPLLSIPKQTLYEKKDELSTYHDDADLEPAGKGWEAAELDLEDSPGEPVVSTEDTIGNGWDDDLDLGDEFSDVSSAQKIPSNLDGEGRNEGLLVPATGILPTRSWCNNSSHAADHIAAGSFDSAMQLLNRQIAAAHFLPMKSCFMLVFSSSLMSMPGLPLTTTLHIPLSRTASGTPGENLPDVAITMAHLIQSLKLAYKTFQKGEFSRVQAIFSTIFKSIPLVITETRSASHEVTELLDICREYTTAVRIKNTNVNSSGQRQMELSAYFTHCNLQPGHLALALSLAMTQAYKGGNFINAAAFARRLLELPDLVGQNDIRSRAQLVIRNSEQKARNEHALNYDERNPFDIECTDLQPIYRGSPSASCPYCRSVHSTKMKGSLCVTCNLAVIGVETLGLVSQSHSK
jgi:coatomer protein complex subunit alpha (xenin)